MRAQNRIDHNQTYEWLLQPHELTLIKKVLNSQRIPFSEENVSRFLVQAITDKASRDYKLNHNASFFQRQMRMESSYKKVTQ